MTLTAVTYTLGVVIAWTLKSLENDLRSHLLACPRLWPGQQRVPGELPPHLATADLILVCCLLWETAGCYTTRCFSVMYCGT